MILYPLFYRRFGVRIAQQLMTPVVSSIDKFEFPRNSVYHFVSFDGVHTGPETSDYLFRHETKPIAMHHITEMVVDKGAPRKLSLPILNAIRSYHAKNKRFRIVVDDDNKPKDETTLYVYNYGFIPQTYRYMRSVFTEYYKWWNIEKTLWDNANKCAAASNRQQFIFMSLPKILPSIATLNLYSKLLNTQFIKIFNSRESLMVLELWKWLSDEHHSESVMAGLDKTSLDKINIVVQDGTNWAVINLGTLDSWKKVEDSDSPQKMVIPAEQLQKRFLRFMMSMTERRAVEEQISVDTDEQDNIQKQTSTDTIAQVGNLEENLDPESLSGLDLSDKILMDLDTDLKKLEDIEKVAYVDEEDKKISAKAIDPQELFKDITIEQQLLNEINLMAEDGILNASEYKRLVASSENFKNLTSPYNKNKTINEDRIITKEQITVSQPFEIPDIKSVTDKSMLKTTLIDFDERYIRDIMPKDNLNMVSNIQKAGIIINSYDVEKVNDVLGNYEFHTLKMKPLQGLPSTLRFKVPTVDDEGNFTVNGNKYKMRKQRGDLPIRKTSPSTVSLQSYYSKCFVQRSSKKVNNYPVWLTSQIMSKGLDSSDNSVTDLKPGDVFNNTFKCPRTYSILGQSFRAFKSGKNNFLFDRSEIEKHFSVEEIKKYESNKNKMTLVGFTDTNAVLLMDKNDAIYEANDTELQVKGTIESMLGISEQFAPIEFSEIKLMGKFLPVGVVLAYDIGFDNLLSLLKVTPRRLSTGERVNLQPHEWSIVFSDETLVFSKDDKLASMVLAGFNEYHRFIRNYSVYTFDKKNVYLNIFENSGLNARYLKEINLLDKLFVDPITKELLQEMKEPETFKGLLLRSSELLLNDQHPDLMDMNFMRIKSYERFSGAIYNELSQAIRTHSNKGGKANSKIELHPYSIWTRITTDPSVSLLDEINPIENLKQIEAVTFSGVGGRMKRAMTKPTRDYHPNDMGVISEATKDSSDVSINTYLSANPQFNSLRGTTNRFNYKEQGATSLVSTSALLSVGSDKDDAKRVTGCSL